MLSTTSCNSDLAREDRDPLTDEEPLKALRAVGAGVLAVLLSLLDLVYLVSVATAAR